MLRSALMDLYCNEGEICMTCHKLSIEVGWSRCDMRGTFWFEPLGQRSLWRPRKNGNVIDVKDVGSQVKGGWNWFRYWHPNCSVSHTVTDGNKLSCASISAYMCLPDTAVKSSDGILRHLIWIWCLWGHCRFINYKTVELTKLKILHYSA
jgi:hypothetical protein